MKDYLKLLFSAALVLSFIACSSTKEETALNEKAETDPWNNVPTYTIPEKLEIPYYGGEFAVDIYTQWKWQFIYFPQELTLVSVNGRDPQTQEGLWFIPGEGPETVKVLVDINYSNEPQTYYTLLHFFEGKPEYNTFLNYPIEQQANPYEIHTMNPDRYPTNNDAQTIQFIVNSPYNWTVGLLNSDISVERTSVNGQDALNVNVTENTTGEKRTLPFEVNFIDPDDGTTVKTQSVTITQSECSVYPKEQVVPAEGGEIAIEIVSHYSWIITHTYGEDILINGTTEGAYERRKKWFYVNENNTNFPRVLEIPVHFHPDFGNNIEVAYVLQPRMLVQQNNTVSPRGKFVPASGGEYALSIKTSFDWTLVNPAPDYFTFSQTSGTGDALIRMTVAPNETSLPIKSDILVRMNDPDSFFPIIAPITVEQETDIQ